MSGEIGAAYLSILPSARGFQPKLESEVGGSVDRVGKKSGARFGNVFASSTIAPLRAIGAAAVGLFAVDKTVGFLKDSIAEARESQKVNALTTSTIKATGGAANVTATQVGNLAGALSLKTGIDDETIQSGQNMLLTFKNIRNEAGKGNDIFTQSTKTLVDLASAMGTEPKQAAIQLGKALNDPIKGISALSRVGVTFDDQQKKQIKTFVTSGKTAEAQKIILKELSSEFGGAAEAQATAGDKFKTAYANLQESLGTALLPVVDKVAGLLTTKVIPAVSQFISQMQSGAGAGGKFASGLRTAGSVVASIGGFLLKHKTLVAGIVTAYASWRTISAAINAVKVAQAAYTAITYGAAGATYASGAALTLYNVVTKTAAIGTKAFAFAQGALNLVMSANPIALVVIAIAGLVAGLVFAYKHSETFRNIVNSVFAFIKTFVIGAITAVVSFVRSHWQLLLGIIGGPLGIIVGLVIKHFGQIKTFISAAVVVIRAVMSRGFNAARAVVGAVMGAIRAVVSRQVAAVLAVVRGVIAVGKIFGSAFGAARAAVAGGIGKIVGLVRTIPGKIKGALGNVSGLLSGIGGQIIAGLKSGIEGAAHLVSDAVHAIVSRIPAAVRKIMGIASPSRVMMELGGYTGQGFVIGLERGLAPATDVLSSGLSARLAPATADLGSSLGGASGGFSGAITITNWDEGVGFMEEVADGSVASAAALATQGR